VPAGNQSDQQQAGQRGKHASGDLTDSSRLLQ